MDLLNKDLFEKQLLEFLNNSPTPFHAVESMKKILLNTGFIELLGQDDWSLKSNQGYFWIKNGSSIVAWRQPGSEKELESGLSVVGAHTDSPCLKIKPKPDIHAKGYWQLGLEVYGGVLLNPWFDRDLSIAGRVTLLNAKQEVCSRLIDFKRPIAVIPSLAIHLDREANSARSVNAQTDLPAILGVTSQQVFQQIIAEQLQQQGVSDCVKVLAYDLNLYDCQKSTFLGIGNEFVSSARLDNLLSCYLGLVALIAAKPGAMQVLVCNDHEEVGSVSDVGAQGPMLQHWFDRVIPDKISQQKILEKSMMVSADNAHGVHPNFAHKHDANHGPVLNQGPVIKINANQRYASTSETVSLFSLLAEEVEVPIQYFVTRTDMGCGSTIGPIVSSHLGLPTVDVGVPQFAMHSIREMAGREDVYALYKVLQNFFQKKRLTC